MDPPYLTFAAGGDFWLASGDARAGTPRPPLAAAFLSAVAGGVRSGSLCSLPCIGGISQKAYGTETETSPP
jgi:hypothetical protein